MVLRRRGGEGGVSRFLGLDRRERVLEARTTGAQALVTACPWCESESNFRASIAETNEPMQVLDVVELVMRAM